MAKLTIDDQFKKNLLSTYPVDIAVLEHILEDLADYFSRDIQSYIENRHRALHNEGLKNEKIYKQIQDELPQQHFRGPEMSIRQIRRAIYG